MPKALITGITGQDGSYLAEFLRTKGYEIHGLKRRSSSLNTARVEHLYVDLHDSGAKFFLHYADLTDVSSLACALAEIQPDEVYNWARRVTSGSASTSRNTPPMLSEPASFGCWRRSAAPI